MGRMMQVLGLCVILGLALAGCGQAISRSGDAGPLAATPTPAVPPPVSTRLVPPLPTEMRLPVPTGVATWTPDPSNPPPTPGIVLTPNSERVQQGQAVLYVLYTHCGIDFATDFDGSFWDAVHSESPITGLGNPAQQGTMTLVDANHARFTWEGGSIDYTRHVGPKVVPGLCM